MDSKRTDLVRGFATIAEFAEALGVSELTVKRWVRKGHLPSVQIGRTRLIPSDALKSLSQAAPSAGKGGAQR